MKGFSLNKASKAIFKQNKEKGFHDGKLERGTYLMLIVSELSEALECDRKEMRCSKRDIRKALTLLKNGKNEEFLKFYRERIKETFETEIIDSIMRTLDLCGLLNIDIESLIELKMLYNKSRPYKHGKTY